MAIIPDLKNGFTSCDSGADPDDYPELFEEIPSQGECTPAPIFNTATPTPTPTVTPTPT